MSFFDKMKSGLHQVKGKAQHTVEITKLYTQIQVKKKDLQQHFAKLGETVYQSSGMGKQKAESVDDHQDQMVKLCREIAHMEEEIEELEQEMHRLKGDKQCRCGSYVPQEALFCSRCGHKFAAAYGQGDAIVIDPIRDRPNDDRQGPGPT